METTVNSEEVIKTNTFTPYNIPDIKREMCDEDLASRIDKFDDFDFEPFHENIFRTLSAHFSNKFNINEIDDACLKLENCFIENNILDKNGLTKSNLKGTNSCIFMKYRDVDDAFVDMAISESLSKINKSDIRPSKKIDLKNFKDNFFSLDFNDVEDPQLPSSDSDSEALGESESIIEPSQSDVDANNSDIEGSFTEDAGLIRANSSINSGNPRHVRLAQLNDINTKTTDLNLTPLKSTVRDIRVMVEKLRCKFPDHNDVEEDNLSREISSLKSNGSKIRQVARKKTGGMVINTNIPDSDTELNKELKRIQPSNEGSLVPDGFDKMTRSDRRNLEKIIAESRANLRSRSGSCYKKNYCYLDNISIEKESDSTTVKELDDQLLEKESNCTSNEREAAGTSNETQSVTTSYEKESNEKELNGSIEDKSNENELLKSVVTNTILDFLIKSKGLKLGKEKIDLISDEITKKLKSFIPEEDGTDADDPVFMNAGTSSTDNKVESSVQLKSNENSEENSSKKRPNPPKKKATKKTTSSASTRKRLQEFQEIARDIINCKLSTPLVDELEEPLRPTTRQSLSKIEKEVHVEDVLEEPRRPITRQSISKNDKDKILDGDVPEEPRKPITRQSIPKINTDVLENTHEEPRRPVTRQSLTKSDKFGLSHELPKETKRCNTTTNIPPTKNDKDVNLNRDEQVKIPTSRQPTKDNDSLIVLDNDVDEQPSRPLTRRFLAKIDKDIDTVDVDKEEPKKQVSRKTVAELARNNTLGSTLSSLDIEMDEPNRRTTRRSLQKQKEISKVSSEDTVSTNELKTFAPKRKSNPRTKKNSVKRNVKKQKSHNKKVEMEAILRNNRINDIEVNEDSIISLSDSDSSKSSKTTNSSFFSSHTILKARADSTTFETEANEEISTTNLHYSPSNTSTEANIIKHSEKDSSISLDIEINSSKSNILINREKHGGNSRSNKSDNYLFDEEVCLPDTSISVASVSNLPNSDTGSDTSDDNLKNVSKLVEDVLHESIKDKFSQNQESFEGSPYKKPFSEALHPSKDNMVSQPVDEPFQILNAMITDIEERLLKEESEANKNCSGNDLSNDVNKSFISDKDVFNSPATVEISADSTSFLNYSLDDSLKLMIDESTPQKENIINERGSPKLLPTESKENDRENYSKKSNVETLAALTNSFDVTGSKEELIKESIMASKQEDEKSNSEISDLKESKVALDSEKEVEINHPEESSLIEDANNKSITEKEVEVKITPNKPEEKSIDQGQENQEASSSSYIDHKLYLCKPLTIEEKIAQLTKRDPRLVNDKKIPNVVIRDPRLRNKNSKNDEKRENVSAVQNISVSNGSEQKLQLQEKLEPTIFEKNVAEPLHLEDNLPESINSEENKKMSDQKPAEQKTESKITLSTNSESKILTGLLEVSTVSLLKDLGDTSQEDDAKLTLQSQKSIKSDVLDCSNDQNRKKKCKKTIDEELLYKTPLSDLHDTYVERSTYERERDFKKKKLFPEGRRVRYASEEHGRTSIPRRLKNIDESTEERQDNNQSTVVTDPQIFFRRDSQEESNFLRPNIEGSQSQLRADHRYSEEIRYRKENLTYEEKTFYQEKKEIFPSGSNENCEQGSSHFIRRLVTETSYSETFHSRNDFQDNHIYSRREFYRRNRYTHDHDHLGQSSRLLENSSNRNEIEFYPQHNNFSIADDPTYRVSAYPPVSFLPEPMYSQEEDIDQSYGNMETESFSPPPTDLCPPPPLIRSPSPELGRIDNYCPSPPRLGRRDSTDERDYEEFSRAYHRNYDNERGFRGRSNSSRGQASGYSRRGNGREYNRWREESPPRKRFAVENYRGRDDDRGVRWRRSPSWSPERFRQWSRERSPLLREPHPWDSPPREQHPWNSPRNLSQSPPRRRDNYRDRSSYYHRY